jgi:hypothetical protein
LTNGASTCDVFRAPIAATTIAANSNFIGTIIDNANAITLNNAVNWIGRALTLGAGSVTTTSNDIITVPTCFHVIKSVIGSLANPSDFNVHVTLTGTDVTGSPASGAAGFGTLYSLSAGTYVISEIGYTSYTQSFSADCAGGNSTLSVGDNKICTITNTYIPPGTGTLHVIKNVINLGG